MRALALILPIALLGLLMLIFIGDPPPDTREESDPKATTTATEEGAEAGIIWISHDWVEVSPALREKRRAGRRETFGLDRSVTDAECFDPNCRACLIDFVYGREF